MVAFLFSLPFACVIPLAPEFEDPPAAQNFAPEISDYSPPDGEIVATKMFRVTVSDPNPSDNLHVRWISDYPPYSPNSRLLKTVDPPNAASSNSPPAYVTDLTVDCSLSNLALGLTQHQITVVIADRDFLPADNQPLDTKLTALPDKAKRAEAHWILNLECK